jgi:putative Holliday junction resolvase
MRILGLDVGDRRIGMAVSDDLAMAAHGLPTVERTTLQADAGAVLRVVAEYDAREVVVGLPKNLDGRIGPQAQRTLRFIEGLRGRTPVPVVPWDERLTTQSAERAMLEAGLGWRQRRAKLDQVAAVLILQNYLDSRAATRPPYE